MNDWACSVMIPEGWIAVDLDLAEAKQAEAVSRAVDEVIRDFPELEVIAPQMKEITKAAAESATARDTLFLALGFEHAGLDVVVMSVGIYGLSRTHVVDIEALAAELSSPQPNDRDAPEVSIVELPAGRAVRVHSIDTPGGANGSGASPHVESLDHFIPIPVATDPATTDLVFVTCSTPSVAIGEEVVALFDEIAATVEIQLDGPATAGVS